MKLQRVTINNANPIINTAKAFYINTLKKVIDVDRVIEKLHQIEIVDNAKSVSQFCNN